MNIIQKLWADVCQHEQDLLDRLAELKAEQAKARKLLAEVRRHKAHLEKDHPPEEATLPLEDPEDEVEDPLDVSEADYQDWAKEGDPEEEEDHSGADPQRLGRLPSEEPVKVSADSEEIAEMRHPSWEDKDTADTIAKGWLPPDESWEESKDSQNQAEADAMIAEVAAKLGKRRKAKADPTLGGTAPFQPLSKATNEE